MFTGIIETMAEVLEKTPTALTIARPASFDDLTTGCSISVNGVCLSAVRFNGTSMSFDVMKETWDKTNLGDLETGDSVNLERALSASARFEGHVVQGHVEGTAVIADIDTGENWTVVTFETPEVLMPFIVPKGGIAIDGISLTVVDVKGNSFSVALIPHTLAVTTLGTRQPGDRVNIETDILGRYILNYLSRRA